MSDVKHELTCRMAWVEDAPGATAVCSCNAERIAELETHAQAVQNSLADVGEENRRLLDERRELKARVLELKTELAAVECAWKLDRKDKADLTSKIRCYVNMVSRLEDKLTALRDILQSHEWTTQARLAELKKVLEAE